MRQSSGLSPIETCQTKPHGWSEKPAASDVCPNGVNSNLPLLDELALEDPLLSTKSRLTWVTRAQVASGNRFPEICRAIVAKRRQHGQWKREIMRRALDNARAQSPPPSLKKIAWQPGVCSRDLDRQSVSGTFVICIRNGERPGLNNTEANSEFPFVNGSNLRLRPVSLRFAVPLASHPLVRNYTFLSGMPSW